MIISGTNPLSIHCMILDQLSPYQEQNPLLLIGTNKL